MAKKATTANTDTGLTEPDMTFDDAYHELERIVAQLERGDMPLEQAIELHTRGQQLAALCAARLDQAELKVQKLDIGD